MTFLSNYNIISAMKKNLLLLLIIISVLFSVISCRKDIQIQTVNLPPTQVLSQNTRYGIISSTHLRLRTEPSIISSAVTTLWKGYVLEIVSRSTKKEVVENNEDYWYQVTFDGLRGWVFGSYLKVFSTLEEARDYLSQN